MAAVVERANAGIAVPPDDPEAFTKALARLVAEPDEVERMGRAGRAFVERWASPAAIAEQYEALFEELRPRLPDSVEGIGPSSLSPPWVKRPRPRRWRAPRAGGNRRAGQRRQLGFPVAIGLVLVVGLVLVLFARDRRNADAFPRANKDHVHSSIDIYTCVQDTSASSTSTTSTTTASSSAAPTDSSTAPSDSTTSTTDLSASTTVPTSTTQAGPNDVHGEYQPPPTDAQADTNGIHTHGDGLIHIHPFADSAAGRKATLGVFLDQVGISMTNDTLVLPGGTFKEGTTKCEGGKDGLLQVAKWDHATDAAKGNKPNQIFTEGFDKIRLGADESFTIAFMPKDSTIPAKPDVAQRIANVSDLGSTTTAPGASDSSNSAGNGNTGTESSSSPSGTSSSGPDTATTIASGSASSSGP